MYLKSLTLRGFKSFADKTHMVFDPGLTVVVGPNGSGKSNISDAILWVLGEQSAKMLRGSAMEDVIFSGSTARGSVNMAEVTLVLDNADQTLPVDYSEVAICRRMYRSGESEYLINNAPCRLLDITEILHDSGLGREMHSIISQGNLDAVLSGRPEDRRELIEEAAGISKHRRRKVRSERKLKSMRENLVRAKDISKEITRQLRPLERQVGKAREAQEIGSALHSVTLALAVDDLRQLQVRHNGLTAKLKEAEAAGSLARLRLKERSAELERYQSLLEEKGIYVGDLGEQRRRVSDQLARFAADTRVLEQKGRALETRVRDLRSTAERSSAELAEATSELGRVETELSAARVEWDELKRQSDERQAAQREAKGRRKDLGRRLAQAQADQRAAQREADQETLSYAKLQDQVGNAEVEDGLFRSRLAQIEEQERTCEERIAERKARVSELEGALKEARGRAQEAQERLRVLESDLKRLRKDEQKAREAASRARASLAALESQDEASESQSALVAALMRRDVKSLVDCRLADVIEAPPELEGLIERLLAGDIAGLVVATADDASRVVEEATRIERAKGTATVLRKDVVRAEQDDQTLPGTSLLSALNVTDDARPLVEALLGAVRVVGDVREALSAHDAHPTCTFVTRDGTQVLPDGRVRVGVAEDAATGSLERKRRIRAMRREVPETEAALEAATRAVGGAEREMVSCREAGNTAKSEAARLTGELSSANAEIGRLENQRAQATAERRRVERQREEAQKKAEGARASIERHRAAAEAASSRAAELSELVDTLADERSEASRAETEADRALSDARLRLATVQERKNNLIVREGDLKGRMARLERAEQASVADLTQLVAKRGRREPLANILGQLVGRLREWQERLEDRATLAEADSETLKSTIGEARAAVEDARASVEREGKTEADLRVEVGRIEVQVETAVAEIEEMGEDLGTALAMEPLEDREQAEEERLTLSMRLQKLGPVNEVAMEEYANLKTRADYIAEQVADLESAAKSLTRIQNAIERKMRTQFLEVFEAVNANFSEVFALLFPGGQAHLEMTEAEDVFECGIEIHAQPRGKKIQKMTLMSGGEKSLVALALLFAVYKTRTVPFYVFDEVEAALDDSNLGKLLDAIEELHKTTQLIVISHQRRTMEQADVLYGVSMQADGVSHVVSQRLERQGR